MRADRVNAEFCARRFARRPTRYPITTVGRMSIPNDKATTTGRTDPRERSDARFVNIDDTARFLGVQPRPRLQASAPIPRERRRAPLHQGRRTISSAANVAGAGRRTTGARCRLTLRQLPNLFGFATHSGNWSRRTWHWVTPRALVLFGVLAEFWAFTASPGRRS